MAHVWKDFVLETSTTTGTGALTLAGAVTGYRAFSAVCATNDTVYYFIQAIDGSGVPTGDWETGLGTYSASNTLTRTTVLDSSTGSAINFSSGTKRVGLCSPASVVSDVANGLNRIGSAVAAGGETTLTVSNIAGTHRDLLISVSAQGSTGAGILTRFNSDSGSNYDVLRQYGGASTGGDQNLSQTSINGFLLNVSATANIFAAARIEVFSYAATDRHKAYVADAFHDAAGSFYIVNAAGRWKSTSAITSVSSTISTGTFAAGSRVDVWARG